MSSLNSIDEIKDVLSENIYYDVKEVLELYAYRKYDYLNISIKDWEKLVLNLVKVIIKDKTNLKIFIGELSRRLNMAVRNFILGKISSDNVIVFDNLLIKLNNNYPRQYQLILVYFFRELEDLEIKFDNNIYELLKNNSKRFRQLLDNLGVTNYSYSDFFKYLKFEIDIDNFNERRINNKNKARSKQLALRVVPTEAIDLYDKFENSLFVTPLEKKFIINYLLNTLDCDKQKLVISYCKGLLYEKDEMAAISIIEEINSLYKSFIENGVYSGENSILSGIYRLILKRKSKLVLMDNNGLANDNNLMLEMVYARVTLKRRISLGKKLKSLELYYLDNGYTLEEFNAKLEKAINMMESEIDCSEEEYVSKFLDILYEDLNTGIFRK